MGVMKAIYTVCSACNKRGKGCKDCRFMVKNRQGSSIKVRNVVRDLFKEDGNG